MIETAMTFFISLFITLIIEMPVAFLFGARRKDLLLVVLINILTNPAVVLLSSLMGNQRTFQILLEIVVIFIEGCYYKKYSSHIKYGFCLAATANILSYVAGLILAI